MLSNLVDACLNEGRLIELTLNSITVYGSSKNGIKMN